MPDNGSDHDDDSDGERSDKNALEWAVSAIGLVVVLSVVGILAYQWIAGSDEPAELVVTLEQPEARQGTVMVPLSVENTGDRVAEAAVIEVCAGPESCAHVTFRYVPQGSTRNGTVGLAGPLAAPLKTRVVSYRTL